MHLIGLVQQLDGVPNAPFFAGAIETVFGRILDELASRAQSHYTVRIFSDSYGVYMRINHPHATSSQLWVSHLDHPAIVFDHRGKGYSLGSIGGVGKSGVMSIRGDIYPVDIFTPSGEFITTTDCLVQGDNISITEKMTGYRELIGIWHVELRIDEDTIQMRSADNHMPTVSALLAIEALVNKEAVFDITLILNSVEEIYQLSMTRQMLRGGIPEIDVSFDEQTTFVVLEAMEMAGVNNPNFSTPNYQDGVLVKVNDDHAVFGQLSAASNNLAEAILLSALEAGGRKYQHTASRGTSDATAIAALSYSPNIVCLAIPCQHKHNVGDDGRIVAETVRIEDVRTTIQTLADVATVQGDVPEQQSLSAILKSADLISLSTVLGAARIRTNLLRHNTPRIEHGFFLPNSLWRKALLARTRLM